MKVVAAVVGTGAMGLPVALRLVEQGFDVAVHDIDPDRAPLAGGCRVCSDAAEAARGADALIVAVVDGVQTDAVLFGRQGAAEALAPGSTVLLCPTIAPRDVERFATRLAERGIATLDAPMSGGPARARAGTMSLMVAGPDAAFERCRALLNAMSSQVFRIGPRPGDGARTKLVNNLLAAINLAGAAEALALAQRLGLDAATTLDVIEHSSGQSWIASDRGRRHLAGDASVRARVALLAKDSRLALAERQGLPLPLAEAAAAAYARAAAAGDADADDSALITRASRDWESAP